MTDRLAIEANGVRLDEQRFPGRQGRILFAYLAVQHGRSVPRDELAEFERHESIDEMKHADKLAERILFLDALPNFQLLGKLRIGENVEDMLKCDLALEMEALNQLKGAIAHCEKVHDYVSRDLFSEILENEEQHVDTLEQQFEMIARMGIQNYVQLQSEAAED